MRVSIEAVYDKLPDNLDTWPGEVTLIGGEVVSSRSIFLGFINVMPLIDYHPNLDNPGFIQVMSQSLKKIADLTNKLLRDIDYTLIANVYQLEWPPKYDVEEGKYTAGVWIDVFNYEESDLKEEEKEKPVRAIFKNPKNHKDTEAKLKKILDSYIEDAVSTKNDTDITSLEYLTIREVLKLFYTKDVIGGIK